MRNLALPVLLGLSCACGGTTPPMTLPDASADAPPADAGPPPPEPLSDFFTLDVAVFQAVKISLTKGGQSWSPNATVAGGKPGVLRVYLAPAGSSLYQGAVQCDVELDYPDGTKKTLTDKHVLSTVSKDSDLKSTFDFMLAGSDLVADMKYKVSIYDPKVPTNVLAFPSDGTTDSLDVGGYVSDFRVQLVPVHYTGDMQDLLPDVSSTQIQDYITTIRQMYPLAKVTFLPTRAPIEWTTKVSAGGTGWDELLMAIAQTRASDSPPADVYYMGTFRPLPSYNTYCQYGCILGLSPVPPADDAAGRVSLITGYSGQQSADTLNHELGHALGRNHAPCGGAQGVDPKFPYGSGGIGVWGWDQETSTLVDPKTPYYDIMSYCSPYWVSDYTYKGLYERIAYVRKSAGFAKDLAGPPRVHQVLSVAPDGSARWLQPFTALELPGERLEARFVDARGGDLGPAAIGRWDVPDLGRRVVFLPDPPPGAARLRMGGRDVVLPGKP